MSQGLKEKEEEEPALKDMKYLEDRDKQSVSVWFPFTTLVSYLFRRENPKGSPVFPNGNSHLSQQGFSRKSNKHIRITVLK